MKQNIINFFLGAGLCVSAIHLAVLKKELSMLKEDYSYIRNLENWDQEEINRQISNLREEVNFISIAIPLEQRRNVRAKIVKNIVKDNIKETRENNFKTEHELNEFAFAVIDFSQKYKVPVSLILAIARQESNFNPRAISGARAQGIMQIIPDTMASCAQHLKKATYDPYYVRDNVECGVWYISQIRELLPDYNEIVMAYNVGPAYIQKFGIKSLPNETKNYHLKVAEFHQGFQPKIYWEQ